MILRLFFIFLLLLFWWNWQRYSFLSNCAYIIGHFFGTFSLFWQIIWSDFETFFVSFCSYYSGKTDTFFIKIPRCWGWWGLGVRRSLEGFLQREIQLFFGYRVRGFPFFLSIAVDTAVAVGDVAAASKKNRSENPLLWEKKSGKTLIQWPKKSWIFSAVLAPTLILSALLSVGIS